MSNFVEYRDWTKKTANRAISIDFIRFNIVGVSGFVINAIMLSIFYKILHTPILISQLIAAEVALISNFTLHNLWTYKKSLGDHHWLKKLIYFHGSSWTGILITTTVLVTAVKIFHINYMLGLLVGALVAMSWNYAWTKYYIFKKS